MSLYLETYKIRDTVYGIEDYEDGQPAKEHFFADNYATGKCRRFKLWRGGCGFGQADTLDEARIMVRDRALQQETEMKDVALKLAAEASYIVSVLVVDDIFNLARFRTEPSE